MKKLLILSLLWVGAGCSLVKSKAPTVALAPQAPHMEQTSTTPTAPEIPIDLGILDNEAGEDTGDPTANSKKVIFGDSKMTLVSETRTQEPISLGRNLDYSLKMVEKIQTWKTPQAKVVVSLPIMTYTSAEAKAKSFNDRLEARIESEVDDFLKGVVSWDMDGIKPVGTESFLDLTTEIETANSKLISLSISVDSYFSGAAHPNHRTFHFNYDIGNEKYLGLDGLFIQGKKYLPRLSALVIEAIKDQKGSEYDLVWLETGAGPKIENYHTVTLRPEGLRVQFDPYDIDSYAAGPTEVLILYGDLKGLIGPNIAAQAQ